MDDKRTREDAARARLVAELGADSWVASTLATYEEQREPEARFVRLLDKVLPKLTHAFNERNAARAVVEHQRNTHPAAIEAAVRAERDACAHACSDVYARAADVEMEGGGTLGLPVELDDLEDIMDVEVDDDGAGYVMAGAQLCRMAIRARTKGAETP